MGLSPKYWLLSSALLLSSLASASLPNACPLLGPVYPAPTGLSSSPLMQSALSNLTQALETLISTGNSSSGPFPAADITTWSIGLYSTSDESSEPFYQFHFTAPSVANSTVGVKKADLDSVYRIGSVTKLFTVYSLLVEAGDAHWTDPITKYIPELAVAAESDPPERFSDIERIRWNDITLGDMANQMAGLGRDYVADLADRFSPQILTQEGFPPLNSSVRLCTGNVTSCDRSEFLSFYTQTQSATNLPGSTPAYSNDGFGLLGLAIEGLTNKTLSEILSSRIFAPLNMTRSSFPPTLPTTSLGILPTNISSSGWLLSSGISAASGQIYSSLRDMVLFGRSILNSTLLPPATTRRWLKPGAHTDDLRSSVGKPWEIARGTVVGAGGASGPGRIVDSYTKDGNIGSYGNLLALVPDYEFGFQIMAAAPVDANVNPSGGVQPGLVADVIAANIFPALEQMAKEQGTMRFAGTYTATEGGNSSITLTGDELPGLAITEFVANGEDILQLVARLGQEGNQPGASSTGASSLRSLGTTESGSQAGGSGGGFPPQELRIYPSNLRDSSSLAAANNGSDALGYQTAWNVLQAQLTPPVTRGFYSADCTSWFGVGLLQYGGKPMARLVFEVEGDGNVVAVRNEALGVRMEKSG